MTDPDMTRMYVKDFIGHAARFEMQAKVIEDDLAEAMRAQRAYYRRALRALVAKRREIARLRYLSDSAQHQVEHCRRQLGDDTTIIKSGDLISREINKQEYLALVNVKCT